MQLCWDFPWNDFEAFIVNYSKLLLVTYNFDGLFSRYG